MSVRAYKIEEIKTKDNSTFNCWHDNWVISYANDADTAQSENGGLLSFQRDTVEQGIEEEKDKEKIKVLKAILKDMADEDYVEYYCY